MMAKLLYTEFMFDVFQILRPLLYPFLILTGVVIIFKILEELGPALFERWRNNRLFREDANWRSDRDLIYWLRGMKPQDFEQYIAGLFSRLGYKAEAVGQSHDGGIDVVIEKDNIKSYIQCKKFITSEVPVGAVRDFYGALVDRLANGKGYFITTNKFTLEAEKFAESKPIELIDSFKLVNYIRMAEKNSRPKIK